MATIAKAALQSAVINAGSNVLAQGIKAHRAEVGPQHAPPVDSRNETYLDPRELEKLTG